MLAGDGDPERHPAVGKTKNQIKGAIMGGVSAQEIQRARNAYDTRTLAGLQSVGGFGGKADVLQGYNHFVGEPDWLMNDLARYARVTPEALKAFATDTLGAARVVVHAVPPAQRPRAAAPRETP